MCHIAWGIYINSRVFLRDRFRWTFCAGRCPPCPTWTASTWRSWCQLQQGRSTFSWSENRHCTRCSSGCAPRSKKWNTARSSLRRACIWFGHIWTTTCWEQCREVEGGTGVAAPAQVRPERAHHRQTRLGASWLTTSVSWSRASSPYSTTYSAGS